MGEKHLNNVLNQYNFRTPHSQLNDFNQWNVRWHFHVAHLCMHIAYITKCHTGTSIRLVFFVSKDRDEMSLSPTCTPNVHKINDFSIEDIL